MQYDTVTTAEGLADFCRDIVSAESVAMDTEFVSERTYRPRLCLAQVAIGGRITLIDAMAVDNMRPFWEALATPGHETIVHAGRGEVEFCLRATDRLPASMFDVQIASGLIGVEYPAGFGTLLGKVIGKTPDKAETRTDWQRRPLSSRQLDYAVGDVVDLHEVRDRLVERLEALDRMAWLTEEMVTWAGEIERFHREEQWRRVSGKAGLSPQCLAIVRELWRWREAEASRRDCPVRRVLRDDLIVELARRKTSEAKRIRAVRGLDRGDLARRVDQLASAVQRALDLPADECPTATPRENIPQLAVLGQFLFSAVGSLCRHQNIAPGLVCTPTDIRRYVAARLGYSSSIPPRLASGWRGEVIGCMIDDLLAGKLSIRIDDAASDHPLVIS